MDPTLITALGGGGVLGALAVVLVALIRIIGSPAKNAADAIRFADQRAAAAEARTDETRRQLDVLRSEWHRAQDRAADAERRAAVAEAQLAAALAEVDRQRNTLGGPV